MAQFRKKPVVIAAVRYMGPGSLDEIKGFIGNTPNADGRSAGFEGDGLKIYTLEGTMTVSLGDWIIKGVKGEFYPCKPDIFAATYEFVGSASVAGPCSEYEGGPNWGIYLDGNPCARCSVPQTSHSPEALKKWTASKALAPAAREVDLGTRRLSDGSTIPASTGLTSIE